MPEDVIVATVDGVVVGYARLGRHMSLPANDHVLHLEALVVSPHARRSGIGALLVEATISEARRRGARKLGLRALSTNFGAIRLYENHGFHEEGRLKEEIRHCSSTCMVSIADPPQYEFGTGVDSTSNNAAPPNEGTCSVTS